MESVTTKSDIKQYNQVTNARGLTVCAVCSGRLFVNGYCMACVDNGKCAVLVKQSWAHIKQ